MGEPEQTTILDIGRLVNYFDTLAPKVSAELFRALDNRYRERDATDLIEVEIPLPPSDYVSVVPQLEALLTQIPFEVPLKRGGEIVYSLCAVQIDSSTKIGLSLMPRDGEWTLRYIISKPGGTAREVVDPTKPYYPLMKKIYDAAVKVSGALPNADPKDFKIVK